MGLFKDAFKWVVGLGNKKLEDIDVEALEKKMRGLQRLQMQWERDIKTCGKSFNDLIDPDKNAGKSKIELRLVMAKSKMWAIRMRELTGAVSMLYRMSGLVDQIKMLKRLHADLLDVGTIKPGLTMQQFVAAVEKLGDVTHDQLDKFKEMQQTVEFVSESISRVARIEPDEADKKMQELLEKLATLQAEGKGTSPEAVQIREELAALAVPVSV